VPFVLALIVACIVFFLVRVFFQNTTYRVVVEGFFEHDTVATISSRLDNGQLKELESIVIEGSANAVIQSKSTAVMNEPLRSLQIDFDLKESGEDVVSPELFLTNIKVIKPYQYTFYFSEQNIGQVFTSEQLIDDVGQHYRYDKQSKRVSIRSMYPIGEDNWRLIIGLSLLFFICSYFLIRNTSVIRLPAFADMSLGNRISSSGEFDTINGLRGLAALLVLLSHAAPGFEVLQMGIAFLFVISGFLLSKPFVSDPQKIFSRATVERYIVKRLKRILPMYYLYIFVIYVVTFEFDTALRHFFFVQSAGHLWPMTQIFAFYMMLPLLLLVTSITYKVHRLLPIIILAAAVYFTATFMAGWKPFYNGDYFHEFFLYAFLIGVLISYIQYDLLANRRIQLLNKKWAREAVGVIAGCITFYIIAWSAPMKPPAEIFYWVGQFWLKCVVSAIIILLALNTPKTLFRAIISNWLFRSVGIIGFSFYILHGLGMEIFQQIQIQYLGNLSADDRSWELVLGAFCITYLMSIVCYSFVERPFFGYREQRLSK